MKYQLMFGDCLKRMKEIPDHSVDLILCDLPYGTTQCAWDSVIDFEKLWKQYKRIIKSNGAIVLFGDEPFSSQLRLSNPDWYKYDWYWRKSRPSGFVNAKLKPLKDIETISVFSEGATANGSKRNMPYSPQGVNRVNITVKNARRSKLKSISPWRKNSPSTYKQTASGYPRQVLDFPNPNKGNLHPTQKPVDLLTYLLKTYTKKNHVVLDNCMGSGSTGEAALRSGRNFIGIEKDYAFYKVSKKRIRAVFAEVARS